MKLRTHRSTALAVLAIAATAAGVVIAAPADAVARLRLAEGDLQAVGRIRVIEYVEAESIGVAEIELDTEPATEA